jgi:HPt (histidine-containing phosphotransfer) domain-containing protein
MSHAVTSESSTKLPLLDRSQFLVRCMGNQALSEKLLATLLCSLPNEQLSLKAAIDSNDLAATARCAHRIRGTAVNVCAEPLARAAQQLEQAAQKNDGELVLQRWNDFGQQIEALIHELSSGAKRE